MRRYFKINILYRNIDKWKVGNESLLLITAPYPGSGKSTLSNKLAIENNALLIQTDELYKFLKLHKNYPIEAKGMNIIEFEELLKDNSFIYSRKESMLICIQFIKEQYKELYDALKIHRFGEIFYFYDKDKIFDDLPIWDDWCQYVVNNYRKNNRLVIFEGGQLLSILIKDYNQELLQNIPLVIIDQSKYRAYYCVALRYAKERYMNDPIRKYLNILLFMFSRINKRVLWDIYDRNEIKFNELKNNNYNIDIIDQPINWNLSNK